MSRRTRETRGTTSSDARDVRRPGLRRALALTLRGLWSVVVLGVVAAVVVLGDRLPPAERGEVAAQAAQVPPASALLVCPGPVRLATEVEGGGDAAYDPQFDPAPEGSATQVRAVTVSPGGPGPAAVDVAPLGAAATDAGDVLEPGGRGGAAAWDAPGGALVLRAEPVGDVSPWVAAAVSSATPSGDLRGLAAASCTRPAAESWLVGGGTELGSSARLVLSNPGTTPAVAALRLWGPSGPLGAAAPEYLVPAGAERVVLLEGVAAEQPHLVVQVTATGGLVTAHLQDSRLRGLVPAGVDHVTAGMPPAVRQVLPGVAVAGVEVGDPRAAAVRLLVPGDAAGVVDLTFHGPDGAVELPGTTGLAVAAGEVVDVPLGGLPSGTYTVVVDADVPVVAGAAVVRAPDAAQDAPAERAWVASVPLGTTGPLAVPASPVEPALAVGVVPGAGLVGPAQVVVEVLSGRAVVAEHELEIMAGRTLTLSAAELLGEPVADGAESADGADGAGGTGGTSVDGVVVRAEDPRVVWAVVLADADRVSVLTPVPAPPARPEVAVRVR